MSFAVTGVFNLDGPEALQCDMSTLPRITTRYSSQTFGMIFLTSHYTVSHNHETTTNSLTTKRKQDMTSCIRWVGHQHQSTDLLQVVTWAFTLLLVKQVSETFVTIHANVFTSIQLCFAKRQQKNYITQTTHNHCRRLLPRTQNTEPI